MDSKLFLVPAILSIISTNLETCRGLFNASDIGRMSDEILGWCRQTSGGVRRGLDLPESEQDLTYISKSSNVTDQQVFGSNPCIGTCNIRSWK